MNTGTDVTDFEKHDQEARSMILRHYGSQRRHWGTILLASIGAFLAVFQYFEKMPELLRMGVIAAIVSLGIHACAKILLYGGLTMHVLKVSLCEVKTLHCNPRYSQLPYACSLEEVIAAHLRRSIFGRVFWVYSEIELAAILVMASIGIAVQLAFLLGSLRESPLCALSVVLATLVVVCAALVWLFLSTYREADPTTGQTGSRRPTAAAPQPIVPTE